jgi:hypothetical protein
MLDAFIVARNPDANSRLPFLLRLPIDGGLWLKARESWPRASRVYCHPCDRLLDVERLDIVERVRTIACERRGPAIDLVLDRSVNRRAQFVFTMARGRATIFWQTPRVAALARPGLRVPFRKAKALDRILVDTRERYGYSFGSCAVPVDRAALRLGDYAALVGASVIAVIERKTADDLVRSLVDGTLGFVLADLSQLTSAAVVVETSFSRVLRAEHVSSAFLVDVLARLYVRYPNVPIVFAESRALGERWSYAFFLAAAAEQHSGMLPLSDLVLSRPEPADHPRPSRTNRRSRNRSQHEGVPRTDG